MRKYLTLLTLILFTITFFGCAVPADKTQNKSDMAAADSSMLESVPLSFASLPATGYINLDPVNPAELDHLGLGGPAPLNPPPSTPYSQNGLYWSEPFPLVEGDSVQIKVRSDFQVSWFGVDWSQYDVRGILATTEVDEDGRAFDPQYPAQSFLNKDADGYELTVIYKIQYDTDCVVVIKNANPDNARRLSLSVSLKPSISLKRIVEKIPLLRNLVASDQDMRETDYRDPSR
jgi:hypothetical protein